VFVQRFIVEKYDGGKLQLHSLIGKTNGDQGTTRNNEFHNIPQKIKDKNILC